MKIQKLGIERYGPFWQVTANGKLLAVCLYYKGANEVAEVIAQLTGLTVERPPEKGAKAKAAKEAKAKKREKKPKRAAEQIKEAKAKRKSHPLPEPEAKPQVEASVAAAPAS